MIRTSGRAAVRRGRGVAPVVERPPVGRKVLVFSKKTRKKRKEDERHMKERKKKKRNEQKKEKRKGTQEKEAEAVPFLVWGNPLRAAFGDRQLCLRPPVLVDPDETCRDCLGCPPFYMMTWDDGSHDLFREWNK